MKHTRLLILLPRQIKTKPSQRSNQKKPFLPGFLLFKSFAGQVFRAALLFDLLHQFIVFVHDGVPLFDAVVQF
jgi:hypothetical protein